MDAFKEDLQKATLNSLLEAEKAKAAEVARLKQSRDNAATAANNKKGTVLLTFGGGLPNGSSANPARPATALPVPHVGLSSEEIIAKAREQAELNLRLEQVSLLNICFVDTYN